MPSYGENALDSNLPLSRAILTEDAPAVLELVGRVGAIVRERAPMEALEPIARALVPILGDCCAIDLETDGGSLVRSLVVHAQPEREAGFRRALRAAFEASNDHAPRLAWTSHRISMRPDVAPSDCPLLAVDPGAVSVLVVPLLARGESFGALTLVSHDARHRHTESDVVVAREIGERIAMAMAVRRLEATAERAYKEAAQAIDHTRRLEAVTAALSNALSCHEAADVITRQIVEGVGASSTAVARLAEGDALEIIAARGVPPEFLATVPLDSAMPAVDALRMMEPIFIESVADREARYPHLAALHIGTGNGAFAAIPLTGSRGVFGVIGLTFSEARAFCADERAFLIALAYHCAQALERARLYDVEHAARIAAECARRRAEFFVAIGQIVSSTLDEGEMTALVAQLAAAHISRWCVIDLVDALGKRHHAAVAHRDFDAASRASLLATFRPSGAAGDPLSVVARTQAELLVPSANVESWPGVPEEERDCWRTLGVGWLMCFPIVARGLMSGAVLIGGEAGDGDAQNDASLGRELATQLAIAIDRTRLFGAARAAVRAREEMVAIVSHDLRTPLNVVSVHAQLLLGPAGRSSDDVTSSAQAMQRAVTRMNKLVSDLLDGERVVGGQLKLELKDHDAYTLVEEAIEPFRTRALERGVSISIDVKEGTGAVTCDRERVCQVVSNLVDNAIKFTPKGGEIRVAARRSDRDVEFTVSDNGKGISLATLPHVFERYWRGPESGRSGVGLGLAIVKGVVDAHGGKTSVESEKGVGTTFHFTLPAAPLAS